MDGLTQYFTHTYEKGSLYEKEKARVLVIACLITIPSLLIGIIIHIADAKPLLVIFGDLIFLLSSAFALYLIKTCRQNIAAHIYLICLVSIIIIHSILTDYFYAHDLTYYRILETTLLFTLCILCVAFFMQQTYQMLIVCSLGFVSIAIHYFIIAYKTSIQPFDTHPFSLLFSYMMIFAILSIIAYRMLKTFTNLIQRLEAESLKVKTYNTELESMVSERTQALESQNQIMKKINHELDRFVYRASHDLRAPLTSILGLIHLAKLEKNIDKVKEYLLLKEKSVKRLDGFIQDIVHVSKNARTEIQQVEIDFSDIIHMIFEQLDYMDNSIHIEKYVSIQQHSPFYSDKHRLSIIVSNLLSNAIRYSAPHRRKSFVKIRVTTKDDMAMLEVEDNGMGIAKDHQNKVFEMFFRANQDGIGSGLGLYIVNETLEKLEGSISVVSTLGKGTIFTVKIPNKIPCRSLNPVLNK
ncbi:signal transduction histidine kinase [Catalinimonas alkaloidigena]|uniref:sensor histidine kinase n=1 Tax=Catalinimonas alkaloidigena TaxID=1075417 RepID=UPI002406B603|nr:HAMP domain-containing sensor histidine kinase [Catalinimonas alkaloidigena]MDF9795004.1 signal transduction histidine kinase [Catalinimonas alkaloidigena]